MKYKLVVSSTAILFIALLTSKNIEAAEYHTRKALIEVLDVKAERNPIKSVRADTWKVLEVKGRIKPRHGQDVVVVCEGDFPAGIIADNLFRPNGEFNKDFIITVSTTVRDICNQQEDVMRIQNPRLFK